MLYQRRPREAGFTLIELVIVMTIIAILSALAFSRYINIQTQARISKAQALYGTIATAANLAKAVCILDIAGVSPSSTCTSTGGSANMTGVLVDMVNQYPAATLSGIIAATQLDPVQAGVLISGTNPINIDVQGGTAPNCRVSYTEALLGSSPTLTIDTSGC